MSSNSIKTIRLELSNTWENGSYLDVIINGHRAYANYYLNGKSSWTSEEAASAIANLINGSTGAHWISESIDPNSTGAIASIAVDNASTVIIRSTIVDGPLEVSYSTSGSSGSPGNVQINENNNIDDSTASNPTISASIADLADTSALVINTSSLEGDTENVYSITDYSWYSVDADNNRTLLQSGTTDNLELTVTSEQNILLATTYLDGELNQTTVESNTLSVDQVE